VVVFDECETDCIGALTLRWCFSKSPGATMMKPPRNGAGLAAPTTANPAEHSSVPTAFRLSHCASGGSRMAAASGGPPL
jgi:hypothetical protein